MSSNIVNLYMVATPIGNLEDITLRALRILKEVDFILAEDTRVTRKLLSHYDIDTPLKSYHQHSSKRKIEKIEDMLKNGNNIALVTDAGTPGISDPGNELIAELLSSNIGNYINFIPIPGASATSALASVSGLPMHEFVFLGFPPQKRKRKKFFKRLAEFDIPVILYESSHRIIKTLNELEEEMEAETVVGRELTKKFETIYRGPLKEVREQIENDKIKGEFVLILHKKK
ncbi:MAG: 16S rRNA (cytidine(1402)-2'-O)-methyltransferase [Candidatus Spechtbacterales bacterium]|nr:16S rRNA (cytidine(1402)-2'-O)-methyltransferase [Candidatus Spechtbacterales bacterium]